MSAVKTPTSIGQPCINTSAFLGAIELWNILTFSQNTTTCSLMPCMLVQLHQHVPTHDGWGQSECCTAQAVQAYVMQSWQLTCGERGGDTLALEGRLGRLGVLGMTRLPILPRPARRLPCIFRRLGSPVLDRGM